MKKSHIAVVVLIVSIVIGGGYYLTNTLFGDPFTWEAPVEYMDPISGVLVEPSEEIFNKRAVNPTVDICIGGSGGGSLNCQAPDGGGGEVDAGGGEEESVEGGN